MPLARHRSVHLSSIRQGVALLGTIDGLNQTFTTPEIFARRSPPGLTISVFYNGQRLVEGATNDYQLAESGGPSTGFDTVSFLFAPRVGDSLTADYLVA